MDEKTIQAVWEKETSIPDYSPDLWRWDHLGNSIKRTEYGNRESEYGWEIDHIRLAGAGGSDVLSNLRPLQWKRERLAAGRQLRPPGSRFWSGHPLRVSFER